jgi:opine dehydrogenase
MRRIAVLGAGSGGCAMAADLTFRGYEVRLWHRRREPLEPLRRQGGVQAIGVVGDKLARVAIVTTDLREAIAEADLVVVTTPISMHGAIVTEVAPRLRAGQVILLTPGHEVLFVPTLLRRRAVRGVRFCEMATLPYAARRGVPGTVHVFHRNPKPLCAAFPASEAAGLLPLISDLFPGTVAGANLLETALQFNNAVLHPAATICNAGWIEHSGEPFLFYAEGITPSVGRLMEQVDDERMAIARALGVHTLRFLDNWHLTGYTTAHAVDVGTIHQAALESGPNRTIRAPATLDHRFLNEDVAYGLVPLSALASLGGVAVPTIDALIQVASALRGVDYRAEGLTLARLNPCQYDLPTLMRVLEHGFPDTYASPRL